jgi:hypothetical protein
MAPAATERGKGLAVDGVGDDREDVVDLAAEEGERRERDNDDECDDQRVLSQALTAIVHPADRTA